MIEFENDDSTRGEQLVLRWLLRGNPFAAAEWSHLRPADFSHDLHGRIFYHVLQLNAVHILVDPHAVLASMREHGRPRLANGVPPYLEWLAGDGPADLGDQFDALVAFHEASLAQHAQREAAKAATKDRP